MANSTTRSIPAELLPLKQPKYLNEIRFFCWIDPFLNRKSPTHNQWDDGWSCRDQAAITAGVIKLLGFNSTIIDSAALFIKKNANSQNSGMQGIDVCPHSFVGIEPFGIYDSSPRLSMNGPSRESIDCRFKCIFMNKYLPIGNLAFVSSESERLRIGSQPSRNSAPQAYYQLGEGHSTEMYDDLLADSFEVCNPPLTGRLRHLCDPLLYKKLAKHLHDLIKCKSKSLKNLYWEQAWEEISKR